MADKKHPTTDTKHHNYTPDGKHYQDSRGDWGYVPEQTPKAKAVVPRATAPQNSRGPSIFDNEAPLTPEQLKSCIADVAKFRKEGHTVIDKCKLDGYIEVFDKPSVPTKPRGPRTH